MARTGEQRLEEGFCCVPPKPAAKRLPAGDDREHVAEKIRDYQENCEKGSHVRKRDREETETNRMKTENSMRLKKNTPKKAKGRWHACKKYQF